MEQLITTFIDGQTPLNATIMNGIVAKINELVSAYNNMSGVISAPNINYNSNTHVVSMSAESGLTIRYTLDGSVPTATTGLIYSAPITLTNTATVKAIATDGTRTSSAASLTCVVPASGEVEVDLSNITSLVNNVMITETGSTPNSYYVTYKYNVSEVSNLTRLSVSTTTNDKGNYAIAFNGGGMRISNIVKAGTSSLSAYDYEEEIPAGTTEILVNYFQEDGETGSPTVHIYHNS